MPINYYPKLAFDSIKKNKQLYIPYIITCILMITIYYIISFLINSGSLSYLPGYTVLTSMLGLGSFIIVIFSIIFLFYTNSFLMKRRKKEFGLYSILGLNKVNITLILFWESLIIAFISLFTGIILGILFSKLFELGLYNILSTDINLTFSISIESIISTIGFYGLVFLLLFFKMWIQINSLRISQLISSENTGEKPPKGNWILAVLGILCLGIGYYIALTLKSPLDALVFFFIAALFVIFGTYLLLISGSVLLCRLLKKNKKYYYKLNHFISVSSMAYRMKRNGAGLASICILSTMVLVILCTTVCLYIGAEDALNTRYPKQINITLDLDSLNDLNQENFNFINNYILDIVHRESAEVLDRASYFEAESYAFRDENTLTFDNRTLESINGNEVSSFVNVNFISLSDYNQYTRSKLELNNNEIYLFTLNDTGRDFNREFKTITLKGLGTFNVKGYLDNMFNTSDEAVMMVPTIFIVVKNPESIINNLNGNSLLNFYYKYESNFNLGVDKDKQQQINEKINEALDNPDFRTQAGITYSMSESREANREDVLVIYGGLFYLGFILSIIFIFATVLIIYYKQISEGFEDQSRFKTMINIGLSNKQIKKTINSQLLTIFFLPLGLSILNLAFAYPAIKKLLLAFNFNNSKLFLITTICSILIFSLFYGVVYKLTSNEYYKIVT